jgi:predicted nucleic acid-binding protein
MRAFLDTNILVYAFVDDARCAVAERLLAQGCDISVQVLNEFANVARRKLGFDWPQLNDALGAVRSLVRAVHPLDLECHGDAIGLAEHHMLSIYDATIIAAAVRAGCDILYSEDMHAGLVIEGRLTIVNPFA